MIKKYVCLFLLVSSNLVNTYAQDLDKTLNGYFSIFDGVNKSTNYLLNKGFLNPKALDEARAHKEGDINYVITTAHKWKRLHRSLLESHIGDNETFGKLPKVSTNTSVPSIPIGIIDIDGNYLNPEKIMDYFDESSKQLSRSTPLERVRLFSISHVENKVLGFNTTFVIDPDWQFLSDDRKLDQLWIDFDDGQGYRSFNPNVRSEIKVSYTVKGEKSIRYKLINRNETTLSYSKLTVQGVVSSNNDTVGRSMEQGQSNRIFQDFSIAGADYRVYYGCGGRDRTLDRPFMIVQGFDPTEAVTPAMLFERYENLGFTDNLLEQGFDIVVMIFTNNHDRLETNAQVLKRLIDRINIDKSRDFENIVLSHSMGGMITRIALAEMERDGEDHEVGLYISFDVGYKGLNIPMGAQHLTHAVANVLSSPEVLLLEAAANGLANIFGEEIQELEDLRQIDRANSSIATRQMLVRHFSNPHIVNPEHIDFQNFLDVTGYPSTSRNIALINGSNEGQRQTTNDGTANLQIGDKYADLQLGGTCDPVRVDLDVWLTPANVNNAVVTYLRIKTPIGLPCLPKIVLFEESWRGSFDDKAYDLAPAGFNVPPDGVTFGNNRDRAGFSPSVSTIDLDRTLIDASNGTGLFYFNESSSDVTRHKSYIVQNNLSPIDDIYAQSRNTEHTQYGSGTRDNDMIRLLSDIEEREIMHRRLYLQNKTIQSGWRREFQADLSVTAGSAVNPWSTKEQDENAFVVENGSSVIFEAGEKIILKSGFKARTGSYFRAHLDDRGHSCGDPNGRSASVNEDGYVRIMPIPEPVFIPKDDIGAYTFDVANYGDDSGDLTFYWIVKGEDFEYSTAQKTFDLSDVKPGQYAVVVSVNGTKTKSGVLTVMPEGQSNEQEEILLLDDIQEDVETILYPNPASGQLFLDITFNDKTPVHVTVLDINGREILELMNGLREKGMHKESFDVNGLDTGIYLLKITTSDGETVKKFSIRN